ncbi:MAG: hypothetical protein K1X89_18670 [Myxococcaceae bacterium]|nr:hypothetical protein [Myxococcaceae bacterium]
MGARLPKPAGALPPPTFGRGLSFSPYERALLSRLRPEDRAQLKEQRVWAARTEAAALAGLEAGGKAKELAGALIDACLAGESALGTPEEHRCLEALEQYLSRTGWVPPR